MKTIHRISIPNAQRRIGRALASGVAPLMMCIGSLCAQSPGTGNGARTELPATGPAAGLPGDAASSAQASGGGAGGSGSSGTAANKASTRAGGSGRAGLSGGGVSGGAGGSAVSTVGEYPGMPMPGVPMGGVFRAALAGTRRGSTPEVIYFSAPEGSIVGEITEDLRVMRHILDTALTRHQATASNEMRMGIPMLLKERGESTQEAYIEGFGAIFSVQVDFPLMGPTIDAAGALPKLPDPNSEWERAKAELQAGGPGSELQPGRGEIPGGDVPRFDATQVHQLEELIVRALRNAVNLRHVKPDESIAVVVTGAPDRESLVSLQRSAVEGLKGDPVAGWPGAVPTTWWGANRPTMMTVRIKKSDVPALAGSGDPEAPAPRPASLSVTTYYGARDDHARTGFNNAMHPYKSGGAWNPKRASNPPAKGEPPAVADGGVTVGGEVKSGEAVVPYRAGLTLLEAIQARDGATDFADLKRVELIREGRSSQHNLRDPKKHGAENVPLQPDDRIVVPRAERPGF